MDHNKTIYIEVDNIRDHPDNPRMDLGDLSELVDSIRQHGIMQNLTVVPDSEDPGGFVVLIGHRRLAAAREAGLDAIPCIVEYGLSRREQVTIMLEENMQRSDLTIIEQANGFQMMLDLGETADSIADKTGFSKSTVYHRLNIAKLDQEILENAISNDNGWQLSLSDLYELEKIEDIDERNEILERASDPVSLYTEVQYKLRQESREKNTEDFIAVCEDLGLKKLPDEETQNYYANYITIKNYDLDNDSLDELSRDLQEVEEDITELCYCVRYAWFYILKKREEEAEQEPTEEDLERRRLSENREKISAITKEVSKQRIDFVEATIEGRLKGPKQKELENIKDEIWRVFTENFYAVTLGSVEDYTAQRLFNKDSYQLDPDETEQMLNAMKEMPVFDQLLLAMSDMVSNGSLWTWSGKYDKEVGDIIKKCDKILEKWGWKYKSNEERAVIDGTSDLYEHEEGSRTDSLS